MSRIVVGFDGSPAAEAALAVAVEEAQLRKLPLRIVCTWEVPPLEYAGVAFAPAPDYNDAAKQHADTVLAAVAGKVAGSGVEVEAVAISGHAASVLLEEAKDAKLLVVGTRGRSTLKGLVLGSVSQALAHHCPTPLLIVPAPRGGDTHE
ncbi:MAG TPA: universal stress protein [Gaiellaceae bacterium]|jgi:nucleotide-binding universal stress UspA family protein